MEEKNEFEGGKEVQSNWHKFINVGDGIKGTLMEKLLVESQDASFSDQMVYKIKKSNGEVWNVGISTKKSGTVDRLNKCKLGEIVGIKFESEGESAVKGGHKSKNLKVYSFGMDATYGLGEPVDNVEF